MKNGDAKKDTQQRRNNECERETYENRFNHDIIYMQFA